MRIEGEAFRARAGKKGGTEERKVCVDPYSFEDALTGSTVACDYPGLQALMTENAAEPGACESLFFPGCSLINYALPLVQSVYDLLAKAGCANGISLLCCGKILSYEPDGKQLRKAFEGELIDHVAASRVKRIIAACPNCVAALRHALTSDVRTAGVEVVPLPVVLADLGYRVDAGIARDMLSRECARRHPGEEPLAPEKLLFMPKDSCPDRKTGEFADGLRAIMPAELVVEGEHRRRDSVCCGSLARAAGKFDLADSQARQHGTEALAAGASAIVTACMSCSFQLTSAQHDVPVFHYLELLFDWRIDWQHVDSYMKLRFLFDDSLGVAPAASSNRAFVGLGGDASAKGE